MAAETLREIRLYGLLGERYGRVHRLAVRSVAEAVRALRANFPGFEADLVGADPRLTRYRVWSGGTRLGEDDLRLGGSGVIRIAPALAGAKRNGVLQTILGVVLIAVGVVLIVASDGAGSPLGENLIQAGIALSIGGVIQLLTPIPKADDPRDEPRSSIFDGPVQTSAQGNCVPVLFGELFVGSAVISAGIEVDQIYVPPLAEPEGGWSGQIPPEGGWIGQVPPNSDG